MDQLLRAIRTLQEELTELTHDIRMLGSEVLFDAIVEHRGAIIHLDDNFENLKNFIDRNFEESLAAERGRFEMPAGGLRLGQFLFYLGIIDFRTLVRALQWQKDQRPYLGRLARDLGILTDKDAELIYRSRRMGERFGDCAVRLGLMSAARLELILSEQTRMTPKIGLFFIENGILTQRELRMVLMRLERRNNPSDSKKTA